MLRIKCDRCGDEWDKGDGCSARIAGHETVDLCDSCSAKLDILYKSTEAYEVKRIKSFMGAKDGIASK